MDIKPSFNTASDYQGNPVYIPQVLLYHCDLEGCAMQFQSLDLLTLHLHSHSPHLLMCDKCQFVCVQPQSLAKHQLAHETTLRCDFPNCDFEANDALSLQTHSSTHTPEKLLQCEECDFSTKYSQSLKLHKLQHTGEKPYVCDAEGCDYAARSTSALNTHKKKHNGEQLSCDFPDCDYKTTTNARLKVHKQKHTGEKPFKCDQPGCEFASAYHSALYTHKKSHTPQKIQGIHLDGPNEEFKCSVCDFKSSNGEEITKHLLEHDSMNADDEFETETPQKPSDASSPPSNEKRFVCDFEGCDYTSNLAGKTGLKLGPFKTHTMIHTGEKPFRCDYENCDYAGRSATTLRIHKMIHLDDKDKPFVCDAPGCDYSCNQATTLKLHKAKHEGNEVCDFEGCGYRCRSVRDMTIHRKKHLGITESNSASHSRQASADGTHKREASSEKLFECTFEDCEFVTKSYSSLKTHKMIHTGERPFVCDFEGCTYACRLASTLRTHKMIHSGEKPFICDYDGCDYRCNQSGTLKIHKMKHSGEKPYVCDFEGCTYACVTSGTLKIHKTTHTGEKPFVCDFPGCTYRCNQSGTLRSHKQKHYGNELFYCDHYGCGYRCRSSRDLTIHKKRHNQSYNDEEEEEEEDQEEIESDGSLFDDDEENYENNIAKPVVKKRRLGAQNVFCSLKKMQSEIYPQVKKEEQFREQKPKNYCSCDEQYNPDLFYIQCESCDQWFHGKCVSIDEDTSSQIIKWFCKPCKQKGNLIQWKPKCANPGCQELSRSSSIYCSSQCKKTVAKIKIEQLVKSSKPRRSTSDRNSKIEQLKNLVQCRKQREQFIRLLEKRQLLIDLCVERKYQVSQEYQQRICGFDEKICTEWVRSLKHLDDLPDSIGTHLQNGNDETHIQVKNEEQEHREESKFQDMNADAEPMQVDPLPVDYCTLNKCPRHEGWEYTKSAEVETELEEQIQLYYQEKALEIGLKVSLKK
ncbi:hypothetical protein HDV06_001608 [Boothiomyces sp. JEL0866]|nr:hypothetical protein HDV06_001608 [Boothiomyces sp. JEL0866]